MRKVVKDEISSVLKIKNEVTQIVVSKNLYVFYVYIEYVTIEF